MALCRELTKRNEEIFRTTLGGAIARYEGEDPRGEYVLILGGGSGAAPAADDEKAAHVALAPAEHVAYYEKQGLSRMDAIKAAARDRGMSKSALYALLQKEE